MGYLNFNTQIRATQLRNNRAGSWIGARDYCLVNEMTGRYWRSICSCSWYKNQKWSLDYGTFR